MVANGVNGVHFACDRLLFGRDRRKKHAGRTDTILVVQNYANADHAGDHACAGAHGLCGLSGHAGNGLLARAVTDDPACLGADVIWPVCELLTP